MGQNSTHPKFLPGGERNCLGGAEVIDGAIAMVGRKKGAKKKVSSVGPVAG